VTAVVDPPADTAAEVPPWRRVARRVRRNRLGVAAIAFVLLVSAVAIVAPALERYDPRQQFFSTSSLLNPQSGEIVRTTISDKNEGPSGQHWLGTDGEGRDTMSRLIDGSRASMEVSLTVVLLALLAALPLGLVAGYFGKWPDAIISRCMDAIFSFPPLTLALAVDVLLGPQLLTVAVAIAIVFVPGFVRIIRGQVIALREEPFIEASRTIGASERRMLVKHVLPNIAPPLIVQSAIGFGYALLSEAGLSVLGFGPPGHVSWGQMLESAYQSLLSSTWPIIPPGLAITLTVLSFNLIGDALRDAFGREVMVSRAGVSS
jgi:ABC-type dipeptide/oligopeptide/nickel transport system permease subunit